MQKNETGLLSTIKKFIRGNAVKVGEHPKPKLFYWTIVKLHLLMQRAPNTHNWNILFHATCKTKIEHIFHHSCKKINSTFELLTVISMS